jgi:hypothetical protein
VVTAAVGVGDGVVVGERVGALVLELGDVAGGG